MAGNKNFVAGVGSTNVDLLYSSLTRLPNEGEELYTKDFSVLLGGGIPATLINLSRLGIPSKIATELGNDIFSNFAKSEFEKCGVNPLNLYDADDIPLNVTSAMITPSDRTFMSYGKGDIEATEKSKEAVYEAFSGAKVVIMQKGGFIPVYEKLKEEGTVLVFDCGWDDELSLETYERYLTLADYYTPNQKEALKITGTKTPEEAAKVLFKYFDNVIVKLDKDGCLGKTRDETFVVPPVPGVKAVDSTGAGDAFLAGFIYGLYYEKPFKECIAYGNITGAKCVTKVGCLEAYVTAPELLETAKKIYNI